jgi:hypothetical protein
VEGLGVFAELGKFQSWIGEKLSLTKLIRTRQSISCLIQDMQQQVTR